MVDVSKLVEEDNDILGLYPKPRTLDYRFIGEGARVVNLEEMDTFFVVWVPEGYTDMADRRVVVLLHGSGYTAYHEARIEGRKAINYGYEYAIVSIQWRVRDSVYLEDDNDYLKAEEVYDVIDVALRYMEYRYGSELDKVALRGFSRGAKISYEVTFHDRDRGNDYFALTIASAGGLPQTNSSEFSENLQAGEYGPAPLARTRFFMYCGMQDGDTCDQMQSTKDILEQYGATVERFIEDPDAKHECYTFIPEAIDLFSELTSD